MILVTRNDLEQPAELAVWPVGAKAAPAAGKPFRSLREAAAVGLEAIKVGASAWIVTEGGAVLSPAWIRGNADALRTAR